MKKQGLHAHVFVHDAKPFADYATVSIRFSPTRDGMTYWHARAQRNNLSRMGKNPFDLDRATLIRFEASKIETDSYADQWDTVPGFGAPYACEVEARSGALGSAAFLAFVRAIHGHRIETPAQLLALLATDRRIALSLDWEWTAGGNVYTSVYDVPHDRRYGFGRFLNSAEVLEAKAAELVERAQYARERAERIAREESEAAE
jgi:hypothetical protein